MFSVAQKREIAEAVVGQRFALPTEGPYMVGSVARLATLDSPARHAGAFSAGVAAPAPGAKVSGHPGH